MDIHYFFVVIFGQVAVFVVEVLGGNVGSVGKMKCAVVGNRQGGGIGYLGQPVSGVGVCEVVDKPVVIISVVFSPALQGEDIARLVVGYRLVVAVGVGGRMCCLIGLLY